MYKCDVMDLNGLFVYVSIFLYVVLEQMDKLFGERGLELHYVSGNGVVEVEPIGMQCQSANVVGAVAVFLVSHNRVSQVFHMYADLVLSACFELHFNQTDVI